MFIPNAFFYLQPMTDDDDDDVHGHAVVNLSDSVPTQVYYFY